MTSKPMFYPEDRAARATTVTPAQVVVPNKDLAKVIVLLQVIAAMLTILVLLVAVPVVMILQSAV